MSKRLVIITRTLPLWVGGTGVLIITAIFAVFVANTLFDGAVPPQHVVSHEALQQWLRVAFLFIALGALWRLRSPLSAQWRWAVAAAIAVLGCAVIGELAGSLLSSGWIAELSAGLGAADSHERRLFRLGAMAAYAVPMLVLLAAGEPPPDTVANQNRISSRIAALLVRWEPLLFAIGASTLASLLLAAAFVHREITWLAPIGADTTVAACAAAAIRAHWRADRLAFGSWMLVCAGMIIGLIMGIYSFGGPVPSPIGDYNAFPRVILRDVHVMLLATGIVGVALSATRRSHRGVT